MSFFTSGNLEKDTENGAPGNFLGPSYFETVLPLLIDLLAEIKNSQI